jgi:hypothetical protein
MSDWNLALHMVLLNNAEGMIHACVSMRHHAPHRCISVVQNVRVKIHLVESSMVANVSVALLSARVQIFTAK